MTRNTVIRSIGLVALAVYGLSIFGANWAIRHVGTFATPDGAHFLPVGFGLAAPSGVFLVGVTLVARDVLQRTIGRAWALVVILPGLALTALTVDPVLALASGAAFALSELADFAVFTPLAMRGLVVAVFASVVAASAVDSLVFLTLAHIPLAVALPGQLVGKAEVALVAVPLMRWLRELLPMAPNEARLTAVEVLAR